MPSKAAGRATAGWSVGVEDSRDAEREWQRLRLAAYVHGEVESEQG